MKQTLQGHEWFPTFTRCMSSGRLTSVWEATTGCVLLYRTAGQEGGAQAQPFHSERLGCLGNKMQRPAWTPAVSWTADAVFPPRLHKACSSWNSARSEKDGDTRASSPPHPLGQPLIQEHLLSSYGWKGIIGVSTSQKFQAGGGLLLGPRYASTSYSPDFHQFKRFNQVLIFSWKSWHHFLVRQKSWEVSSFLYFFMLCFLL